MTTEEPPDPTADRSPEAAVADPAKKAVKAVKAKKVKKVKKVAKATKAGKATKASKADEVEGKADDEAEQVTMATPSPTDTPSETDASGETDTSDGTGEPRRRSRRRARKKARDEADKTAGSAPATQVSAAAVHEPQRERRYVVPYDVERPHIRLGLIWFVLVVAALVVGRWGLAVVYGLPAAVGALQIAKAWRRRGRGPFLPVAGLSALAMALASPFGGRAVGVVVLVAAVASVIAGALEPGRPGSALDAAGHTVRSWLNLGLAAASVVLVYDYQPSAAVCLVILVSAYEAGDYMIGSGSPNAFEGPVAGIAAVAVFSFSLFVIEPSPFEASGILLYGAVVAVLAPAGQLLASALLPTAGAIASGLRRLDSMLLAGPVWVLLLQAGVGQ